jgi:hypothetical protein
VVNMSIPGTIVAATSMMVVQTFAACADKSEQ